jgi:hypothetical protein
MDSSEDYSRSEDYTDDETGEKIWENVYTWPEKCTTCKCPLFKLTGFNNDIRYKLNVGDYIKSDTCGDPNKKEDPCECDDCCCGSCGSRKTPHKTHC